MVIKPEWWRMELEYLFESQSLQSISIVPIKNIIGHQCFQPINLIPIIGPQCLKSIKNIPYYWTSLPLIRQNYSLLLDLSVLWVSELILLDI